MGHCQARPMQECLSAMTGLDVEPVNLQQSRWPGVDQNEWFADLASRAAAADQIYVLNVIWNLVSRFLPIEKVTLIPTIRCDAYHPDATFVTVGKTRIPSVANLDHSKLAVFAWCQGLSAGDTVRLFTPDTFRRIGYTDAWRHTSAYAKSQEERTGWPMVRQYEAWRRGPAFMLNRMHPKLFAHAQMCRMLAARLGLRTVFDTPENYLADPHGPLVGWPVYPGVAETFGLEGNFQFFVPETFRADLGLTVPALDLEGYIERCFEGYARFDRAELAANVGKWPEFADFDTRRSRPGQTAASPVRDKDRHPYTDIPDHQHFHRALAGIDMSELDPVVSTRFSINAQDKVATAGSCFAQHISAALTAEGLAFLNAEPAPPDMAEDDARAHQYGIYSARYGNIYSPRQLLQLFDRAFGRIAEDEEVWQRPDGRYADPFRPTVEPGGFENPDDVLKARRSHLSAVRAMFEQLEIFLFTLGITEAWRRKADGAVYPVAPGVAAGRYDPSVHEFVNFTLDDVVADLEAFFQRLRDVNPKARLILTVSPVSPVATYETKHIIRAATGMKSVLRVAADIMAARHEDCDYFPGYEVVAHPASRGTYVANDLRTVTPEGAAHVARLFLKHYAGSGSGRSAARDDDEPVICDDELLL
ncbi:GSCFA domain-containing protein [Microbaculum marinum]|uniref:GSCFA domain-containing protein n=1 Tax=Microbaculum marinum TaxID=1764581 RepID=UPI003617896C